MKMKYKNIELIHQEYWRGIKTIYIFTEREYHIYETNTARHCPFLEPIEQGKTMSELLDELQKENERKVGVIVDYICDKIYLTRQTNADINRKDVKNDILKILEGK